MYGRVGTGSLSLRRACGRSPMIMASDRMTHIHDSRLDMVVRFVDVGKQLAQKALGGRRITRATATLEGVAVFTIDCATVYSACAPTPHGAMNKRLSLLQRSHLHRQRRVAEDISAAS